MFPDFQVIHSSHQVHVSSNYRVVTNATTGDSILEDVKAHWNQTTVNASGRFTENGSRKGRTLFLNTEIGRGRLEDLLLLFTSRPEPAMRGGFQCKARIELPPNPPQVSGAREDCRGFSGARQPFHQPAHAGPDRQAGPKRGGWRRSQTHPRRSICRSFPGMWPQARGLRRFRGSRW